MLTADTELDSSSGSATSVASCNLASSVLCTDESAEIKRTSARTNAALRHDKLLAVALSEAALAHQRLGEVYRVATDVDLQLNRSWPEFFFRRREQQLQLRSSNSIDAL